MASPNLSELITTTLRHRNKELADNVTNSNALLSRLHGEGDGADCQWWPNNR